MDLGPRNFKYFVHTAILNSVGNKNRKTEFDQI